MKSWLLVTSSCLSNKPLDDHDDQLIVVRGISTWVLVSICHLLSRDFNISKILTQVLPRDSILTKILSGWQYILFINSYS
jgi:hypothetical protein